MDTSRVKTVRVLVADDSAFARLAISRQLRLDPEIEVVGVACNGIEALEKIRELKPSVITLDVEMPQMNGLETLENIMSEEPIPVVMLSSLTSNGAETTIRALELGAVDFFLKLSPASPAGLYGRSNDLSAKVKQAARVERGRLKAVTKRKRTPSNPKKLSKRGRSRADKVVVVGSSTGGPGALYQIVPDLPRDIPASILIVQHMPAGFTKSLADRLNELSQIEVKEAQSGDFLLKGQALLAPGNYHMTVTMDGKIGLNQGPSVLGLRPAADVTMLSVAKVYAALSIGVVLTGMGSDGTKGAAFIKAAGGKIAVQDKATCVVYGMPRSVVESGHADKIIALPAIAREIVLMCQEE